jgi:futalosine hydrolase
MGIAGSFNKELKKGFVVEVFEDNFSEIGFEDNLSFSSFKNFEIKKKFTVEGKTELKKVRGITVNTVHGNSTSISEIIKRESPDVESMEGAAIFKVCEEFGVACIQIRSISNKVEVRDKSKWDIDLAISNLNFEVEKIINYET